MESEKVSPLPSTNDPDSECCADDLPEPDFDDLPEPGLSNLEPAKALSTTDPATECCADDLPEPGFDNLPESGLNDLPEPDLSNLEPEKVPSTTDPDSECRADDLPEPGLSNWDLFEPFPDTEAALNTDLADAAEVLDSGLWDGGRDPAADDLRDAETEPWLMELCAEKNDAADAGDDGLSITAGSSRCSSSS